MELKAEVRPIAPRPPEGTVAKSMVEKDTVKVEKGLVWRRKSPEPSLGASAGGQQKSSKSSLGAARPKLWPKAEAKAATQEKRAKSSGRSLSISGSYSGASEGSEQSSRPKAKAKTAASAAPAAGNAADDSCPHYSHSYTDDSSQNP